jgi:hypothetical protein
MAFFLSAHKLRKATRELTVRVFQTRKSCLVSNAASVLVSINITKPVHAYEAAGCTKWQLLSTFGASMRRNSNGISQFHSRILEFIEDRFFSNRNVIQNDSRKKVNILRSDSIGHCTKKKSHMNMCVIPNVYSDRAV